MVGRLSSSLRVGGRLDRYGPEEDEPHLQDQQCGGYSWEAGPIVWTEVPSLSDSVSMA